MAESRREAVAAVACSVAAMLCFSSVPVFLRHLAGYLDAWTVNALRYGVSAVFWLPFVLVLGRQFRLRQARDDQAPRRSVWLAALLPTAPNLLGQVGWAACPYYIEASTIAFVIRMSFLFTVVLGFLVIPAERPLARRPMFFIGTAASVAGIFLMYVERLAARGLGAGTEATGLTIALGTSVCWAGYAVCVRKFMRGYPLRLAFGVISLYTSAGLVLLMLLLGDWRRLADLLPREWVMIIVSAFLGIAIGHVLYHRGIHGVGPVVASGVTMVGPFATYLLAIAFLGETMTTVQLIGGLAVVAGGLALVWAKAQLAPADVPDPPCPPDPPDPPDRVSPASRRGLQ